VPGLHADAERPCISNRPPVACQRVASLVGSQQIPHFVVRLSEEKSMQTLMIRLLVFLALAGSANAAQTTYNFNFSNGGTGSFVYNDAAMTTSAITFDFGALGSIAPYDFGSSLTATVFGNHPRRLSARTVHFSA
jgi:hypothetical protein